MSGGTAFDLEQILDLWFKSEHFENVSMVHEFLNYFKKVHSQDRQGRINWLNAIFSEN